MVSGAQDEVAASGTHDRFDESARRDGTPAYRLVVHVSVAGQYRKSHCGA
jgi:hypothetical protein